ncbi:MAG: hypothetical protein LBH72_04985 [Proteiniphilum sp.]|jgi:hypothetical protein|nr:hypothetical protein [Proteiniphilum sp.]
MADIHSLLIVDLFFGWLSNSFFVKTAVSREISACDSTFVRPHLANSCEGIDFFSQKQAYEGLCGRRTVKNYRRSTSARQAAGALCGKSEKIFPKEFFFPKNFLTFAAAFGQPPKRGISFRFKIDYPVKRSIYKFSFFHPQYRK